SESKAKSFLQAMSPDSPIWLMYYPVLTTVVNHAGLENSINHLKEIVNNSPYKALRGEALYNLIRYYHKKGAESKWYSYFTLFVSNYPNHIRVADAYENYAPDQPIEKGDPLPYSSFGGLKEGETIALSELDASYIL